MKAGGVVAFPTETVYGIGASIKQPKAIKRIFKIKKRPKNKPLQVLIANLSQAKRLGKFNKEAEKFAKNHWPGPLTLVVYKKKTVPKLVTGGSLKVGLRVPAHSAILKLIKKSGPIVATSANKAGEKPALTAAEAKTKLPEIDYVLPGRIKTGKASKVVDATKGFKTLRD